MSVTNEKKVNNSSGVGVGSASIVLIFAVLCLTVFTLITYIVANNHKALIDNEAELVLGYYRADTLAEGVIDWMLTSGARSGMHRNIEVTESFDETLNLNTSSFYCTISESKSLFVDVVFHDGTYSVLSRRMVDNNVWVSDGGINVWPGE